MIFIQIFCASIKRLSAHVIREGGIHFEKNRLNSSTLTIVALPWIYFLAGATPKHFSSCIVTCAWSLELILIKGHLLRYKYWCLPWDEMLSCKIRWYCLRHFLLTLIYDKTVSFFSGGSCSSIVEHGCSGSANSRCVIRVSLDQNGAATAKLTVTFWLVIFFIFNYLVSCIAREENCCCWSF